MPTCRSCSAPILWARTTTGKPIPLDAERTPDGNLELCGGVVRYVTPDHNAELRYRSHFSSCPNAAEHRKAKR